VERNTSTGGSLKFRVGIVMVDLLYNGIL